MQQSPSYNRKVKSLLVAIGIVLLCLDHVASFVVNANQGNAIRLWSRDDDFLFRPLDQPFLNRWPFIVSFAAFLKIASGKASRREVFRVNNHQFTALLFTQQMDEPYRHHIFR